MKPKNQKKPTRTTKDLEELDQLEERLTARLTEIELRLEQSISPVEVYLEQSAPALAQLYTNHLILLQHLRSVAGTKPTPKKRRPTQ